MTADRGRRLLWTALGLIALIAAPALAQAPPAATAPPAAPSVPTTSITVTASQITTKADMEAVFDQMFTIGLDTEHPLSVAGLKIKRDTMELTFAQGTMFLAKPILGQVTGAYFTGSATMRLTIPSAIDRKRLEAEIGKPSIDMAISQVVLRFDDGTEREILAAGKPAAGAGAPGTTWNDRLQVDALSEDATPMDVLHTRINGLKHTTLFTADFPGADGKTWYRYVHNGAHRIEDALYKEEFMGAGGKRLNRIIAQFHRPEDYDAKGNYDLMPESDAKDVTLVRHNEMTVVIPNTKAVDIDARLTVEALRDNVRALRFNFVNNLDNSGLWDAKGRLVTAQKVADAEGNELPSLHRWHEMIVLLPKALTKGERAVVQVKANEDTIIQLTDKSYWIYTTYPWFPQMGELGGRYTMDWTVKIAKPMKAAGTGEVMKEWEEGDMNCARWKSDVPVQMASFIFGSFKVAEGSYKREAPGTGEVPIRIYTILGGEQHSKANPEAVIYNIGEGIKTYETIYGPFPYPQLDVAEMAKYMGFAQAPAGVLLISSVAVGGTALSDGRGVYAVNIEEQGGLGKTGGGGTGDQFLFHELAHQWWGHQISWVGDEDQWMSEALAEYSAGMMVHAIDPKRFERMRKDWRQHAMDGDPWGTLAMANYSETPEHPGTRWRLVYNKGPYVIHMLRTWMGWEKFTQYTNALQTKYRNTSINNDTLAREAGKVLGYSMFPFFDQWVRDKGVPKVHYTWSTAADAEGKQVITVKLRQEDTANPKILMLPIALDFGKGAPTVVQKPLLKAEGEIQLRVPEKPKGLTIDPQETQLAVFIDDAKRK